MGRDLGDERLITAARNLAEAKAADAKAAERELARAGH
jgi:hypothetical protein